MRSLLFVALLSVPAFAQQPQQKEAPKKVPVQVIDFAKGSEVGGDVQHPLGTIYTAPPKSKFDSLLKMRTNFNDKLMESVNEM